MTSKPLIFGRIIWIIYIYDYIYKKIIIPKSLTISHDGKEIFCDKLIYCLEVKVDFENIFSYNTYLKIKQYTY